LQAAVIAGHFETCRLLLQKGADPDQQDRDGDTPRDCAKDDPELRTLLFQASTSSSQGLVDGVMDANEQEALQKLGQQAMSSTDNGHDGHDDGNNDDNGDDDNGDNDDNTDRYMDALDNIPMELDDDGDM
jgi:ankyrin repeat protein